MKRRLVIYGGALVLYAALMVVTWVIGTRKAAEKTDWQLDYAVIDFHDTVAGAIDTMLGHIAQTAVRHVGRAQALPMERMADGAKELDIDEVNIVDRAGRIVASNDPNCMGVEMAGDPVMDAFMTLTNGTTATVSQPFRPHARNPEFRAKYLAAPFPGGDGFVQVGLDERRLARMLPEILGYIFDQWLLGQTGFFLCADAGTGRLISNPSRHRDEARTLAETGYDPETAAVHEFAADGRMLGETFVQRLFGEDCYCRAFRFGGHLFVAALPEREFYDTRTAYATVMGVLLFAILAAFAWLLDRILRDRARIRAFYAAEGAARAREMEVAKTIQGSALPAPLGQSPYFRLYASMTPARDVGGDFYDFFFVDSTHLAFLVADVSGKGIAAALYMMTAKTSIKDALINTRDVAAAFTEVNAELCRSNTANMFLTAWCGVLDLETGEVAFVNAGHNPPVKSRGRKIEWISAKSGPMLAFVDGVKYKSRTMRLAPGDALFLYTDGVTEAMDAKGTLFGEERLAAALSAVPSPEPDAVCGVVRAAVAAFAAGAPASDDLTVLAVEYVSLPSRLVRTFPPTQDGISQASAFLDEAMGGADAGRGARDAAGGGRPEADSRVMRLSPLLPALHVVLDEIVSNIVKHSGASGFEIDMEFLDDPPSVELVFIDDGAPYNPLDHADPDTSLPADERPIGGLGILMVKKMASSMSYRRARNRNQLAVRLSLAGG